MGVPARVRHRAQMQTWGRAWKLYFFEGSSVSGRALQGHLRGHFTRPLASGHAGLPLFPPFLTLEQAPLSLKLLHALHIAGGRAKRGVKLQPRPPWLGLR